MTKIRVRFGVVRAVRKLTDFTNTHVSDRGIGIAPSARDTKTEETSWRTP